MGVVGVVLAALDGHSCADLKDISDIAVCGSGSCDRFCSLRNVDTTVSPSAATVASKGFLTSFATLMIVSNSEASSAVGSRNRYTPQS